MATIERREQSPGTVRYRVRWWANDKQRSKTFDTYSDSKRFKAMLEGDLANGTYTDPRGATRTVHGFAETWWSTVIDLRPTTHDRTALALRHVLDEFGNLPLSGVTHAHITRWVASQMHRMGASSVRKNTFTLKRMLDAAVREGLIKTNPAAGVRLPAEPRTEQRFLDMHQIDALLGAVAPRYRPMLMVSIYGGLRYGEVAALSFESVDFTRSTVSVTQTLIDLNGALSFGPPKTRTSVRVVTLPRSVMAELKAHCDRHSISGSGLLFTFPGGKPLRRAWFRQRVWLPATEKAGLSGLRFHDLRHTFVALWVSLGRNPKEVSKVAGHSSVAFTLDRYGHLYDRDDDGLADALDKMLVS